MAEYNMIPTTTGLNIMSYVPTETKVTIFEVSPINPTRVQKIFNNMMILPILNKSEDTNGVELNFKREVREWDVVLPFGNDSHTPRRTPTEISFKGKKLKNSFM